MGLSPIADAQRQHATGCARRLSMERTAVLAAAGALVLTGLAVLAIAPTGGHGGLLALLWLVASLGGVGWLTYMLIPRRTVDQATGAPINVIVEPGLHQWAVDLAHRAGVSAPGAIRIAPGTGAWLDDIDGDPFLVIGAASLGWLTKPELERVVGMELTMLRVREDDTVLSALRLSRSLKIDTLRRCTTPVVGRVVRVIGRRLALRSDELHDACVDWCMAAATPQLTPTEADVKEASLVEEAWKLLMDQWLTPAARRGLTLDSLMYAHRELLTACEENGLVERQWTRTNAEPALALLADPADADRELADWTARRLPSGGEGVIGWDDYVDRIVLPNWRQSTAELIAAISAAGGHTAPATIDAILSALDSGIGAQVGALLAAGPDRADEGEALPTTSDTETALSDAIAHAASLALADLAIATATVDLLWGVTMRDDEDKDLEVEPKVRAFVAAGDVTGLRWYLQRLGLDTGRTIGVDGDAELYEIEPSEPTGRSGLALLTRRGS